jgi:muramoyltetrapeptide carboxypeptidase
MRKPRALVEGDRIAIVAPASPFDRDEFERGVEEIKRLGFLPVYDESVFARRAYVAGAPDLRAAAFQAAWDDPAIAGVIAARGGYGSAQILPLLDAHAVRLSAKCFIGYSDLTALLTYLTLTCGVVAFHGPMLEKRLANGEAGYDRDSFRRAVCRAAPMGEIAPATLEALRPGDATGVLLGGTLTQILASLGTPYAFAPPPGYVLFIEEVGERPYRLDRMVTQLKQAGLLKHASAVVIGELVRCDEPSRDVTARAVMADVFADFPGPVLIGLPSGHTSGPSLTLPLGITARVVADSRPRLVVEEAAVV